MRFKSRMALSMEETNTVEKTTKKISSSDSSILAETLVNDHFSYLYRLAASILDDPQEADDAVQETILRALAHWQDGPTGPERRGWLTVLAVNYCRDRLRRRKARQSMVNILQALHLAKPSVLSIEDQVGCNQIHSELWKSVQALDEKHRLPVILKFVHGMSAVEIAESLQISEGTVYSRLHYAIHKLRERLGPAFEEGGLE